LVRNANAPIEKRCFFGSAPRFVIFVETSSVLVREEAALVRELLELPREPIERELVVAAFAAEQRAERAPALVIGRRGDVELVVLRVEEAEVRDGRADRREVRFEVVAVDGADLAGGSLARSVERVVLEAGRVDVRLAGRGALRVVVLVAEEVRPPLHESDREERDDRPTNEGVLVHYVGSLSRGGGGGGVAGGRSMPPG
jgi:hypothetical protein